MVPLDVRRDRPPPHERDDQERDGGDRHAGDEGCHDVRTGGREQEAPLGEKPPLGWVCVRRSAGREAVAATATVAPAVANHLAAPVAAMVTTAAKVAANLRQFLTMESPRLVLGRGRSVMDHYSLVPRRSYRRTVVSLAPVLTPIL
jgi:hypothetical protein